MQNAQIEERCERRCDDVGCASRGILPLSLRTLPPSVLENREACSICNATTTTTPRAIVTTKVTNNNSAMATEDSSTKSSKSQDNKLSLLERGRRTYAFCLCNLCQESVKSHKSLGGVVASVREMAGQVLYDPNQGIDDYITIVKK
jgi:hypothetical protein